MIQNLSCHLRPGTKYDVACRTSDPLRVPPETVVFVPAPTRTPLAQPSIATRASVCVRKNETCDGDAHRGTIDKLHRKQLQFVRAGERSFVGFSNFAPWYKLRRSSVGGWARSSHRLVLRLDVELLAILVGAGLEHHRRDDVRVAVARRAAVLQVAAVVGLD